MNKLVAHWKLIGALLLVFVSGNLCGSLGTLAVLKKKILQARDTTYLSDLWTQRLESKLDLSKEQAAEIRSIVENSVETIRQKHRAAQFDMQATMGFTDALIMNKLTEAQQKKYQELKAQRTQRIKKWLGEKE